MYKNKNKNSEYSALSRIISGMLISVILFVQISAAPISYAQAGSNNEPEQSVATIAILVDNTLLDNNNSYEGLTAEYSDDLKENNFRGRIYRFAKDVQLSQAYTQSVIIRVNPNESPVQIAQALETLYYKNKLEGVITVGNVPLPVVNKNGYRFVSLYPYTDFEDKLYIYNSSSNEFEKNPDVLFAKQEAWHGVIKPPKQGEEGLNQLAYFFDKNHLYHIGNTTFTDFDRRMLFADILAEQDSMDKTALKRYDNYVRHMADFAYLRFTKTLLKELSGANDPVEGDGIDNDMDGFIDEDPIDNIDNDNDGLIDEDNGENPEAVDAATFDTLPDVQSKNIISTYALKYGDTVKNYLQKVNDFVKGLGRYEEYDSVASLIAVKDLYTQEYLKTVNDAIEAEIDKIALKLQGNIALIDNSTISGTITFSDATTAGLTSWEFINYTKNGGLVTLYNGKPATELTDASQCSIYKGGQSNGEDTAQMIETNRVFRQETAKDDVDNSGYDGCYGKNILHPERCFTDLVTKWVADKDGMNVAENVPDSAANYSGCYDFREKIRFEEYLTEVNEFINSGYLNQTPADKHRPSEDILLYQNSNFALSLKDILDLYGGFDGKDNDNDGQIDEPDEYSLSYSITKDDWYTIGREILGSRKTHFIISNPPFEGITKIELDVAQAKSTDGGMIANNIEIPSITFHKEPTLETIQRQMEKGNTLAMPANNPRYTAFQDLGGNYQRINYPDAFKADSINDYINELKNLEQKFINMPGYSESLIPVNNVLQQIILKTENNEYSYQQVDEAINWRNMSTDVKHAYIIRSYLDKDINAYIGEPEKGYEYLYLTADGTSDELNFEMNKDPQIKDNDQTWLDPNSTLSPESQTDQPQTDDELNENQSVFILQWFTYILGYLKDVSKLPNNLEFKNACGKEEEESKAALIEDVQQTVVNGKDALEEEKSYAFDADANGVPDSADATNQLALSIQDNITKIPSDGSNIFKLNIKAFDSTGFLVNTDSYSEVKLELIQESEEKSAKIYGQDTIQLVNGEGVFNITSTGVPGEFSLMAHTLNRPAKIISNSLDIESEGKKVKVLTYKLEIQEPPTYTQEVLKDYLVKDSNNNEIAVINSSTGKIQIKDKNYEVSVFESTADKPMRIGINEIKTGSLLASVVIIPNKEATPVIHEQNYSLEDNINSLDGIHVKDLNKNDFIQAHLAGNDLYIYDNHGFYSKRIAKITSAGKVYTADEYFINIKNQDNFDQPYIFILTDAQGNTAFEFAMGYPQGNIQVQQIDNFNVISYLFNIAYAQELKIIDTDKDGLSDFEEITIGTDRLVKDSDNDGYTDKEETQAGYDPQKTDVLLFSDLAPKDPAYSAFIKLFLRGIVKRTADNKIRPNDKITREEYVQMVLGLNCTNCSSFSDKTKQEVDLKYNDNPFPDQDTQNEYRYCIEEGKNSGIISGYASGADEGYFKPKYFISRAEAVKVILNAAGIDSSMYLDTSKPWYYRYILKGQELKIFPEQKKEELYPINNSSVEDFKKWVDIQTTISNSNLEKWVNEDVTRAEFAILVKNVMENKDCYLNDADSDGLPDNIEKYQFNTDTNKADTDNGGKNDLEEIIAGKDPLNPEDDMKADTDGDGMQDTWEQENKLDEYNPADANFDNDNDGLTNLQEFENGTNPRNPDTDEGGKDDGDEVLLQNTDPNNKDDDGNGVSLNTGLYAIGNNVSPDIVYEQVTEGEEEEVPVYVDNLPADNESTLYLTAEILNENGDIMTDDSSTVVEFYVKDDSETSVEILQPKIIVKNGVATTQIKSSPKAGQINIDARIVGRELPTIKREVFAEPLEPAKLEMTPDSPVIKTGGLSKTPVRIKLLDKNDNIVNNSFNELTVTVDGPGLIDPNADTKKDQDGTQLESYEGLFSFDLYSTQDEGDITIRVVLNNNTPEIETTTLINSTNDIKLEITSDKENLIANGQDIAIFQAEAVDSAGAPIKGFNQLITFKTSNTNAGAFITEPVMNLIDGVGQIMFKSSTIVSALEITATVPGLDSGTINIPMVADIPYEIKLKPFQEKFDSSSENQIWVEATLYDKLGNAALNLDNIPVTFKITDSTSKYAEIAGESVINSTRGRAVVNIKGKNLSGPVHIIATVEGLKSATITLQAIKKIKGTDLVGSFPSVLYATMIGAAFGDTTKENYTAGALLFAGKTQAVTALTTDSKPKKPLININYTGGITILDDAQVQADFVPANTNFLPNRVLITNPDTNESLAEAYYVYPQDLEITIQDSIFNDTLKEGIFVIKQTSDEAYGFIKKGGDISITYNGEEGIKILNNGQIRINDNFFNLTLSEEVSPFLALSLMRGEDKIADIIFAINLPNAVQIANENFEYQAGYPYPAGVYIKPLTSLSNYKLEGIFSGLSTNLPKGAALINTDLALPDDQVPATIYEGLGFDGDNKQSLFFAAGNNVGNSNLPYALETTINLGDPTIRIKNESLAGSSGYTEDIGTPISYGNEEINEMVLTDFNNDSLKDVLLTYESGKIKLIQNQLGSKQFKDKGTILDIKNGIYSATSADFNNDGYDDLLISTKDSCLGKEVCLYIYENQNGNFTRNNINLDITDKISQVKVADLNNDNYPDIILSDFSGNVRIYYNNFGEIETTSQLIENLGINIDSNKDLKEEILIHYSGMPEEIPDDPNVPSTYDDDLDYKIFQLQTGPASSNEFLSAEDQAAIAEFGGDVTSMSTTEDVSFIYMDKDPVFGTTASKKQAIDINGGTLTLNDKIVYTLTFTNTSGAEINDLMVSDILPDSLELDNESLKCLNCAEGENLQIIESGQSLRPYVITGLTIPAGESRIFTYETKINSIPKIYIDLNKNFDAPFIKDEYIDLSINPEGNSSGKMVFYYSVSKDPQTGKMTYARFVSEAEKSEPLEQPVSETEDTNDDGFPDSVPAETQAILEDQTKGDDDNDGIPNSWDEINGEIDGALKQVEDVLNKFSCSGGGCMPTPINMAFLVPGMINVMGIPAGFDPGLPVFGWGATSPIPVWPPTPYQSTQGGRLYVSPTLTGSVAVAVCLGPYLAGQCWATPLPISLVPESVCNAIQEALTSIMSKVTNFVSSANSSTMLLSGGGSTSKQSGASLTGRNETGGISGSSILGGYSINAGGNTNSKIPGFPGVITDWFAKQMEEIIGKLSDLPDLYVLYPDINSIVNYTPPEAKFNNFTDVLTYINKLPLITLESKAVTIKIPAISQKDILKLQSKMTIWVNNLKAQLKQFKQKLNCDKPMATGSICTAPVLEFIKKLNATIQSVEKNIKILDEYKTLPRKILEYRNIQTKYIKQIICYLDTVLNFAGGYFKRQQARIKGWMDFVKQIKKSLETWKAISNIMTEYTKSCDACKTERTTLYSNMMNIMLGAMPEIPVIPFPKWPDFYFDFSQIQLGLKIIWPDVKFKAEPLIFPELPTIQLPSIPTTGAVKIPDIPVIPEIPAIPELPALPELPDLPPIPVPTLPDIPKPPRIPQIGVELKAVLGGLAKIVKILCLVKKSMIPVMETNLKSQIESLTARPLKAVLPLDTMFKFQSPSITYPYLDKIKISAKMDFRLETDAIYNAVNDLANEWNGIITDVTDIYNTSIQQASQAAQGVANEANQTVQEASQAAQSAVNQANQAAQDAANQAASNLTTYMPDKIYIKAEQTYLYPDVTSETQIQDLPAGFENTYITNLRSDLIAYSEELNSVNINDINSDFNYPELSNFVDTRMVASLAPTDIQIKQDEPSDNVTELEEYGKNITKEINNRLIALDTNAVSSNRVNAQEASNPTTGQQIQGLYVYNKDENINESILAYLGEVNKKNNAVISDFDDDTDEDIIYSYGGNVYYKENYKKPKNSKFLNYISKDPDVYDLSEFIPLSPSVNGFSTNYDSGKSVDFSWKSANSTKFWGYEIVYNSADALNKINIFKEPEQYGTIGKIKNDLEITVIAGSFTVNGETSGMYAFGDTIDTSDSADTKIVITFSDSSQIILGPSTSVKLPNYTPGNFNLVLSKGTAIFKSNYFTNIFLQEGSSVAVENASAQLEFKNGDTIILQPNTVFFGSDTKSGYAYLESIEGQGTINALPRTYETVDTQIIEINKDTLIHTMEDSVFVLNSGEDSKRLFSIKANTLIPISNSYAENLKFKVISGKVELINIKSDSKTDLPLEKGMLVAYNELMQLSSGTATVRFSSGAKTDLTSGQTLTLKELTNEDNPLVSIESAEGNYYSQVYTFDQNGYRSNPSDVKLMAPQLCSDKEVPFADAGLSAKEVIVMQKLEVDASKSFDTAGKITSYYFDLNPDEDTDGDGDSENDQDMINEDQLNPVFVLGPFNEVKKSKVVLNVTDESLNIGKQIIEINVIVPSITLDGQSATTDKITGSIDKESKDVPITIIRNRNGIFKNLGTANTDEKGAFELSGLNYEDTILVRNSNGDIVAEIDTKTGRVVIVDNNYYTDVLEAVPPNLPTRIVVKEKDTEIILATILMIPDMNTDTVIEPENTNFTNQTVAGMNGVHIVDRDSNDNISFVNLPASDPNFTGATEILDNTTNKRLGIIDSGGSIYFFDDKLDLQLKQALSTKEPILIEILNDGKIAGEVYIAVNNVTDISVKNRDVIGMPPEDISEVDSDNDGMSDKYEYKYGFDALDPNDANLDADGDSLSNLEEFRLKTDPLNKDTDGDGFSDAEEVAFGKDPLTKASSPFADVSPESPYYQNIVNLSQKNILRGEVIDDKLYFKPKYPISRKDFTDIILKMLCIVPRAEAYKEPTLFSDITYTKTNLDYYYAVIKEAVLQGFITGYIGEVDAATGLSPFKPENSITKAEAVKIVLEALEKQQIISLSGIQPAEGEAWYAPYISASLDLTPFLLKETEVKETYILTQEEAANPNSAMTRAEFVAIADRVLKNFDCYLIDDDKDGMPSVWELQYGLNPFDPKDANEDPDKEGLINLDEYKHGTNPFNKDTDGGGASDKQEVDNGTNPVNFPQDDRLAVKTQENIPKEDFRKNLKEGIYVIEDTCNSCPCKSAIDHKADLIKGDIIFGTITSEDLKTVFTKSNEITFKGLTNL